MMDDKDITKLDGTDTRPGVFSQLFEKNGFYDGKVFFSEAKATFTFLHDDEVMVLHFDLERMALYFNGHCVRALSHHPDMPQFLTDFKKNLLANKRTRKFVSPLDRLLSSLEGID